MSDYVAGIERNVFASIKSVVDVGTVEAFVQELKTICSDKLHNHILLPEARQQNQGGAEK